MQSSSVFTSTLNPLVGLGLIEIDRVFPLVLGSNIGTTVTGILASFSVSSQSFPVALQIALCHTLFNVTGIVIWYPIPFVRKIPLLLAKRLGNASAKYRWFAIVYLVNFYFLVPIVVFALSLAGWYLF
jgi:solute carrier family 34 (sodium-dependent phosphate cotransporter)